MDLGTIKRLVGEGQYEVSFHAQQERLEDDLDVSQVETAILTAQIIERYPDDPRGESCLLGGWVGSRPIHVVVGWARKGDRAKGALRVITVYEPKLPKWKDSKTRGDKR